MQRRFHSGAFQCDVDVYTSGDSVAVRFYDASREQREDEIVNLVIVDAGFGWLSLKRVGSEGLLSGFLDYGVFSRDELVMDAVEFVQSLVPWAKDASLPQGVELVRSVRRVEYNGEY